MSQITAETVSKVTANIAAAALDPSKWQNVVSELHGVFHGTRTHVFGHDQKLGRPVGLITEGYREDFLKSFSEYYGSINEWMPGFLASGVGNVAASHQMVDFDHLRRTEFYNDWVLPQEDIISGGGAILFSDHDRFIAIGGNIRARDQEQVEADFLSLLRIVLPHLQLAFDTNRILLGHSLKEHVANCIPDAVSPAVLLVGLDGRIKFACGNAERVLSLGQPLSADLSGRLRHSSGEPLRELEIIQREMQLFARAPVPRRTKVATIQGKAFEINLLGFAPGYLTTSPFGSLIGLDHLCVLVSVTAKRNEREKLLSLIEQFRLTETEAEVAILFARGMSPAEISDRRSVSIATTRNQIRAIYSKLNASGQLEVSRLVGCVFRG